MWGVSKGGGLGGGHVGLEDQNLHVTVMDFFAWIKKTVTELLDSEVLTLPGGLESAAPRSLV